MSAHFCILLFYANSGENAILREFFHELFSFFESVMSKICIEQKNGIMSGYLLFKAPIRMIKYLLLT